MKSADQYFSHVDYGNGVYAITAPLGEQMYLVLGTTRAALIDTGMGIGPLRSYITTITSHPLVIINTHGHPDHAGGNMEFASCLMHPADKQWFLAMCNVEFRRADIQKIRPEQYDAYCDILHDDAPVPDPVADGDEIDLGGRMLKVCLTPGHTPGSICLFDELSHSLFVGDMLSSQSLWMYGNYSEPLNTYYHSILKVQKHFPDVSQCYAGHKPEKLPAAALQAAQMCARRILMHDAAGTPVKTFAGEGMFYQFGDCKIIYNPDCLF